MLFVYQFSPILLRIQVSDTQSRYWGFRRIKSKEKPWGGIFDVRSQGIYAYHWLVQL